MGGLGERKRERHASTEELEAGRRRVTLVEMTSVREKARTAAQ
jgi:hypothetical protein